MRGHRSVAGIAFVFIAATATMNAGAEESDSYHEGELAGSLRCDGPLPIYDPDPKHLWNRLFAAFYIRPSNIPSQPDGRPIKRIEGGDVIDFLGWADTTYWSSPKTAERLNGLLDEFLENRGAEMIADPLRRAILLRDLWAAYDFLSMQNVYRKDGLDAWRRRDVLCGKLARVIRLLAPTTEEIESLPDTYPIALRSGRFESEHRFDASRDYLPYGLLTNPEEWVEIEFHQPDIHEDLADRFITLHTRSYRGRSYFRIFYRFPGGREQLTEYLKLLEEKGVDWKQAAQFGFMILRKEAPQIPIGSEFALVQFMMTLDDRLRPTPTGIVESIRLRVYRNVDGSSEPETNTGVGMNVSEYTLRRRLLFDGLKHGGLHREPDDLPQYRVIFQGPKGPDWGYDRRKVLFQQCADCHMTPRATRTGVHSVQSIVNSGGFNAGAQLGIAIPLPPDQRAMRGLRAARWKTRDETYRRLLEYLGR